MTGRSETEYFTLKPCKVPNPKKLLLNPIPDEEKDYTTLWPEYSGYLICH